MVDEVFKKREQTITRQADIFEQDTLIDAHST